MEAVARSAKHVMYDSSGRVLSCLFCRICAQQEPAQELLRAQRCLAFRNIRPCAPCHLLVAPIAHVQNVHALAGMSKDEGVELLRQLREAGEKAYRIWLATESSLGGAKGHPDVPQPVPQKETHSVEEIEAYDRLMGLQFCYHIPPYNSVDHLHLHVIAGRRTMIGSLIYNTDWSFWCKTHDNVLNSLGSK